MLIHKSITLLININSAIQLATNPIIHERIKHIEINCYFISVEIKSGPEQPLHVSTQYQVADILTKSLGYDKHCHLLSKLGVLNIL